MKKSFVLLIAVTIILAILAGCGETGGVSTEKEKTAEESAAVKGTAVENAAVADTDSHPSADGEKAITDGGSEQTDEEQVSSYSEYFTDEQLGSIRKSLRIPDSLSVEPEIGEPYFWDGAGIDLVQVDFYHDGEYVAGAACEPYTENVARNIYTYSE